MRAKEFIVKESALDQMIQKAGVPVAPTPKQPGMIKTAAKEIGSLVGGTARAGLDAFRSVVGAKNTNIKAPRDAQGNVISNDPQPQQQQPQQQQPQQQAKTARIAPIVVKSTGNPQADEILKQQGVQVNK